MNKGMAIWLNRKAKIRKKTAEAQTVREEDKDIDRYIKYSKQVFAKTPKRMHRVGVEIGVGHQIKNRCYTKDGSFYLVRMKTFKILKVYDKEMPLESKVIRHNKDKKNYKLNNKDLKYQEDLWNRISDKKEGN